MVLSSLDPHLEVFDAVRKHLVERGFEYMRWMSYPHEVPEIPRPALFPVGDFRGLDLSERTSSFPHELNLPVGAAYFRLLENLQRERAGPRGRPIARVWQGFASEIHTSVSAIFCPMRSGYYGVDRPGLAFGYHVAEFVYLLHRMYPSCEIEVSDIDFFIVAGDNVYGIVGNEVVTPSGEPIPLAEPVDISRLTQPRQSPGQMLTRRLPLWRAIHAFSIQNGLTDDPDFMQALAHARWALPGTLDWQDQVREKTKNRADVVRYAAEERASRVAEAYRMLEAQPRMEIRKVRRHLVPSVMSRQEWGERLGHLTRHKRSLRGQIVETLKRMQQEYLSEA